MKNISLHEVIAHKNRFLIYFTKVRPCGSPRLKQMDYFSLCDACIDFGHNILIILLDLTVVYSALHCSWIWGFPFKNDEKDQKESHLL